MKVKGKEKEKKKKMVPSSAEGSTSIDICVKSEVQSRIKKRNSAGCFLHVGWSRGSTATRRIVNEMAFIKVPWVDGGAVLPWSPVSVEGNSFRQRECVLPCPCSVEVQDQPRAFSRSPCQA